ncbi:MAG: pyridoxamine 5-phosphate oxidase-related FMN-binding [Myxococcales bacterium]|nr:pyridoxamine 5-phosphate oxidase-related FMN-binding [Myxococcales bacterium]
MSDVPVEQAGLPQLRALLAAESMGLLSTISVHRAGFPFGSLMPYAVSAKGAPLLLLSALAAHTKNLLADPRACLYVGDHAAAEDPTAGARVSLLGRAARVATDDEADARARYVARHPRAEAYFALRDFALWQLAIEEARLISGFGSMRWLPYVPDAAL